MRTKQFFLIIALCGLKLLPAQGEVDPFSVPLSEEAVIVESIGLIPREYQVAVDDLLDGDDEFARLLSAEIQNALSKVKDRISEDIGVLVLVRSYTSGRVTIHNCSIFKVADGGTSSAGVTEGDYCFGLSFERANNKGTIKGVLAARSLSGTARTLINSTINSYLHGGARLIAGVKNEEADIRLYLLTNLKLKKDVKP
jgi:hypothetical protein